jgi:ribonuclease M5
MSQTRTSKVVLIVEGHKDAFQVAGALGDKVVCVVTDGTKVNNSLKSKIDTHISNGDDLYILSDPDEAGDHLAVMIQEHYDIPRIHADYEKSKYCKDLRKRKFKAGIEYCSYKYLRELLGPYINIDKAKEVQL